MLTPTRPADPDFPPEEDLRKKMIRYIRRHFSGLLGDDVRLLDLPNGLEILRKKYGRTAADESDPAAA